MLWDRSERRPDDGELQGINEAELLSKLGCEGEILCQARLL